MQESVKAIVIDYNDSGISWIGGYQDIIEELKMEYDGKLETHLHFDAVTLNINGVRLSAYVDDEGLLKGKPLTFVEGYPEPLAGKIVITGAPDDEGYDTSIPFKDVPAIKYHPVAWDINYYQAIEQIKFNLANGVEYSHIHNYDPTVLGKYPTGYLGRQAEKRAKNEA